MRSIGRLLRNIGRLLRDVARLLRSICRLWLRSITWLWLRRIRRLLRRIHWLSSRNRLSRLGDKRRIAILLILLSKTFQTLLAAETNSNYNNNFKCDQ